MKLIIGLGNPGKEYENTRHNIGFELLDGIADEYGFSNYQSKFKAEYSEGLINGQKIRLIKPQTFMNLSGKSVIEAKNFYKIDNSEILVIHDELDVELGKLKIKSGGGNGGHNGIKSIDNICGKDYFRLRYGISHPGVKSMVSSYVLSKFTSEEQEKLENINSFIIKNFAELINGNHNNFLSKFGQKFHPPKLPKKESEEKEI